MILIGTVVLLAVIQNPILGSPLYSSSVYLQRGRSVPLEYVEYSPPLSGYPQAGLSPCGGVQTTLCIYEPGPPVPAPLQKVAVLPNQEVVDPGYQYSYIILNDGSVEKPQQEMRSGAPLYGEYSLVQQPTGYSFITNLIPKPAKIEDVKNPEKGSEQEKESKESKESPEEDTEEAVEGNAEEAPTDTPKKEEKTVLTLEDIIHCSQAIHEEKKHENNPDHEEHVDNKKHDGHEEHKNYETPADHEKHPAQEHKHEHVEGHGTHEEEHKPPKRVPDFTYVLLPSNAYSVPTAYGVPKPC